MAKEEVALRREAEAEAVTCSAAAAGATSAEALAAVQSAAVAVVTTEELEEARLAVEAALLAEAQVAEVVEQLAEEPVEARQMPASRSFNSATRGPRRTAIAKQRVSISTARRA